MVEVARLTRSFAASSTLPSRLPSPNLPLLPQQHIFKVEFMQRENPHASEINLDIRIGSQQSCFADWDPGIIANLGDDRPGQ